MKKYNYKTTEIWFTKRALEWLTISTIAKMTTKIRYAYDLSKLGDATRDLIFIYNKEGRRTVRRKMEIYNLEAVVAIMNIFKTNDFPDYWQIANRIRAMREESFRERYLDGRNDIPSFVDPEDLSSSNMSYMHSILGGDEIDQEQKRRRLITDVVNDYITQYYEDTSLQHEANPKGRLRLLEINRQSS